MRPILLLLAILLAPLGGCELADKDPTAIPPAVLAAERRVDAIPGRTLVLPVDLRGHVDLRTAPRLRLDDGRDLDARLVWIGIAEPASGRWATYRWLAPPGRWIVIPASAGSIPPSIGAWFVVADLPLDSVGQGLWLGRARLNVHWLSLHLPARAGWTSPAPLDLSGSRTLLRLAEPDAQSPVRRWRSRLLSGTLLDSTLDPTASPPFDEPILEALARQNEARWAFGLSRLERTDPGLALSLARALAGAVQFEDAVLAPVWTLGDADHAPVLDALLDPRLADAALVDRVRAWIDAGIRQVAWIVDDAGLLSPTGVAARLGVANLTPSESLLAAAQSAPGTRGSMELRPIEPRQVRFFEVEIPAGTGPILTSADVRIGTALRRLEVMSGSLPAEPPGLLIAPFFRDWTLATWMPQIPEPDLSPEWATAAVLQRDRAPDEWVLTVECRWAPPTPDAREVVRIWLGPRETPHAVLRLSSDGVVIDERATEPSPPGWATVVREPDRWIARVRLPAAALDDTIRLGIERIDARARRSAWPRPMLPWQPEPGRALVNLRAWR